MADTKVQLQRHATKAQKQVQRQAIMAQKHAAKAQKQAAYAAAGVSSAAQSAAQGFQSAAHDLQQATIGVRTWAAPRLESAADYTTSTMAPAVSKAVTKEVAPRVSDALRVTAKRVRGNTRRRPALRPTLAWTALGATVLAGAGAVGVLLWRRYRAALADDSRLDAAAYPAASTDGVSPEGTSSEDGMNPPVPDPASTAW